MRRMPLSDAFFLINESRRTPIHVGALNLYTLPRDVDEEAYLSNLSKVLHYDEALRRPFGDVLKTGPLGTMGPMGWEPDDQLDIDYHIRHSALPRPGRYRELFSLVSRLHGTLLDRSRPLWEMHLIEGLQNRQFATYFKVHHCVTDGAAAIHLINSMHSSNPRSRLRSSPFSLEAYEAYKQKVGQQRAESKPREADIRAVAEILREQLGGAVNVSRALSRYASVWLGSKSGLAVPFRQIPRNDLSTRINGARRFVAQSWPLERVRGIAKELGFTLNDVVLAMCAGALRRHFIERGNLPKHSLKAMAPVSVRAAGDLDSANAVGFITADMGTHIADPEQRLKVIKASMDAGKQQLAELNQHEIAAYNAITQAPLLLASILQLAARVPAFSLVVSNVPGPRKRMYLDRARLDGIYPLNIPYDGFALSVTLVSNVDSLDFGLVACRRSMPHVQRLIDDMEESLTEIEAIAR